MNDMEIHDWLMAHSELYRLSSREDTRRPLRQLVGHVLNKYGLLPSPTNRHAKLGRATGMGYDPNFVNVEIAITKPGFVLNVKSKGNKARLLQAGVPADRFGKPREHQARAHKATYERLKRTETDEDLRIALRAVDVAAQINGIPAIAKSTSAGESVVSSRSESRNKTVGVDLLGRVTTNPAIFGGKPIIRGRRLAVEHILGMLAAGDTAEIILAGYDWLEPADIQACLAYASRLVGHERIEPALQVPGEAA